MVKYCREGDYKFGWDQKKVFDMESRLIIAISKNYLFFE